MTSTLDNPSTPVDVHKNSEAAAGATATASTKKHDVGAKIPADDDTSGDEKDNPEHAAQTTKNAKMAAAFAAARPVVMIDVDPNLPQKETIAQSSGGQELSNQLLECENTIIKGLKTFVDVGSALAKIRDQKLFKPLHETFDDYLEKRWGFTKQHASHLILAAGAHTLLAERVDDVKKLPTTERAMRELLKAPEDKRAAILDVAAKDGEPTTESIAKARATVVPKKAAAKAPKPMPVIKIEAAIKAVSRWADYLEACDAKALTPDQRTELATAQAKAVKGYKKFNLAA